MRKLVNIWIKRLVGPKNHFWKQLNINLMFPKIGRLPENSVLRQTRIKKAFYHLRTTYKHLLNKFRRAENSISKTIKSRCKKSKTRIRFWNHFAFKSTAVLRLSINSTFIKQSGRTQVAFAEISKRSSKNFEKEDALWKFRSFSLLI